MEVIPPEPRLLSRCSGGLRLLPQRGPGRTEDYARQTRAQVEGKREEMPEQSNVDEGRILRLLHREETGYTRRGSLHHNESDPLLRLKTTERTILYKLH